MKTMFLDEDRELLQGIDKKLGQLLKGQQIMSSQANTLTSELASLQNEVTNNTSVEDSALTLIQGIPTLIQNAVNAALANGATPDQLTQLQSLITTLQSNDGNLAAAVTANTQPGISAAQAVKP